MNLHDVSHRARFRGQITWLALAAIGAAVFAAWALSPAIASAKPDGVDPEVMALMQLDKAWSDAASQRDLDKVISFYDDKAVAYPPNQPVAMGRDGAQQVWARYFIDPSFNISWKSKLTEVAKSGDLGYTAGTYKVSYKTPDGNTVQETGKYLCVWKKQVDGSWKAMHDMWNADAPK